MSARVLSSVIDFQIITTTTTADAAAADGLISRKIALSFTPSETDDAWVQK